MPRPPETVVGLLDRLRRPAGVVLWGGRPIDVQLGSPADLRRERIRAVLRVNMGTTLADVAAAARRFGLALSSASRDAGVAFDRFGASIRHGYAGCLARELGEPTELVEAALNRHLRAGASLDTATNLIRAQARAGRPLLGIRADIARLQAMRSARRFMEPIR